MYFFNSCGVWADKLNQLFVFKIHADFFFKLNCVVISVQVKCFKSNKKLNSDGQLSNRPANPVYQIHSSCQCYW